MFRATSTVPRATSDNTRAFEFGKETSADSKALKMLVIQAPRHTPLALTPSKLIIIKLIISKIDFR